MSKELSIEEQRMMAARPAYVARNDSRRCVMEIAQIHKATEGCWK